VLCFRLHHRREQIVGGCGTAPRAQFVEIGGVRQRIAIGLVEFFRRQRCRIQDPSGGFIHYWEEYDMWKYRAVYEDGDTFDNFSELREAMVILEGVARARRDEPAA
jgi:hypothetical protein